MAPGGIGARVSGRLADRTAHGRGLEGPVVAVRRGHRGVRRRVGVAAAPGLALMAGALWERLARVFGRGERERQRSEAERILLEADFGVEATEQILDRVSGAADGPFQAALERAVLELLTQGSPSGDPGALARAPVPPTVLLIFGVNGVGKTTAVAKLGARLARGGRSVLFAAADTFRAGAAEQLQIWADRLGAPHESLLVVDATVGQNAVHQARAFAAAVPLSGLIVTKLDGTAKGGSVVALERAVRVPIRFLGTGEGLEDLEVFDPNRFARRLISG